MIKLLAIGAVITLSCVSINAFATSFGNTEVTTNVSSSNNISSSSSSTAKSNAQSKSTSKASSGAFSGSVSSGGHAKNGDVISNDTVSITQQAPKIPVGQARGTTTQINQIGCGNGVSVGAQTEKFGISFGKPKIDKECQRNQDAAQLYNQGMKLAAKYRHCESKMQRLSMEAADKNFICPKGFYQEEDTQTNKQQYDPNSP